MCIMTKVHYLPTQLSEAHIEFMSSTCRLLIAAVEICKRKSDVSLQHTSLGKRVNF